MTVTLDLTPETEASLLAQAGALGLPLDDYLQRVIQEQARRNGVPLAAEEWTQEFDAWVESFPDRRVISDDALRRENLHPDRW